MSAALVLEDGTVFSGESVGAEGFAFAGLMSIMNLAELCSNTVGAWLYDHVFDGRLGPLIIVSAASTAFALVLVPLLRLDSRVSR